MTEEATSTKAPLLRQNGGMNMNEFEKKMLEILEKIEKRLAEIAANIEMK